MLTHVPPITPFSMIATQAPSSAALIAAAKAADRPPMIIKSKPSPVDGICLSASKEQRASETAAYPAFRTASIRVSEETSGLLITAARPVFQHPIAVRSAQG